MRQWGKITTRTHGTLFRHDRMNFSIEEARQHLDDFSANSAEALGEDVCAQQEHGPDFGLRQRSAQSASMAPQQIHLQFRKMVARDANVRELAEAGVDAIDGDFFSRIFSISWRDASTRARADGAKPT